MPQSLKGKTVLITGGSSGIGRAAALAFASEGCAVAIAARREAEGEETVELVRALGGEAFFCRTDVSLAGDVERMVAVCVERLGRLDFAFNNAGIEGTPYVPTADYDEEVWDQVLGINLKGVWLCMKYQIPQMLRSGGGAIVNISSVAGLKGGRIGSAYYASKHGVIGLTKAAAMEYADKGIRINAVCPAVIQTEMAERSFFHDAALAERTVAKHPIGRIGTPEEVAAAVVWLCSDGASFVTGHALPVDGGLLL
ncbi:MAG: SDR family oxidoreductase [Opitutaceae bacterium]